MLSWTGTGGRRRGEVDQRVRQRLADAAVVVDRAEDLVLDVHAPEVVELVADLAEVRLADHLVDMGLELAGHPARLLDHLGDGLDGDRQVLGPDEHERHHADQG